MNWPPNPTQLNDLLINAVCEDGLKAGGPNAARIVQIHRQLKSPRSGSEPNKPLPVNK